MGRDREGEEWGRIGKGRVGRDREGEEWGRIGKERGGEG